MNTILEIKHLGKSFGTHEVLKDIDFKVSKGDVISIIGASGSGKSTLLRCINLLETPTHGEIWYQGKNVLDRSMKAPEYRSHVGMVFQSFNLFNNMTVLENCMVGQIKVLKRSREEAKTIALEYLQKVDAAQQRRLAGAGCADDGDHVALVHSEINVPEHHMGAEGLGKMFDFQNFHYRSPLVLPFFSISLVRLIWSVLFSSKGVPRSGWL